MYGKEGIGTHASGKSFALFSLGDVRGTGRKYKEEEGFGYIGKRNELKGKREEDR